MNFKFEELTHDNYQYACAIKRDDIPEAFVDTASTIMDITDYGIQHNYIGHTFLVRMDEKYVGLLLLGEAIPWDTDPDEMKKEPFYRLMGFVIDKDYRGQGLGGEILEKAILRVYEDFGRRPIALGCHKDNIRAAKFYMRHGFRKTNAMEGNDEYYLRKLCNKSIGCEKGMNISMKIPIKKKECIQTKRLCLKPYSLIDKEQLIALLQNSEITKTFMVPDFESEGQVATLVDKLIGFSQIEDTKHLEYGVYLNDLVIGFINDCGMEEDEIEIGYVIHPDYKGCGYATEAVKAVIDELHEMGFHKIRAGFFEEKIASKRVMEKCGMHPINLVTEETYRGVVHKCLYYEICF